MQQATRERMEARRALAALLRERSQPSGSTRNSSSERKAHRTSLVQNRFEAGVRVIMLALSDEDIIDFQVNAGGRSSDEQIASEIESLFLECVHSTTQFARGKLVQLHVTNASKWQGRVSSIIEERMPTFYTIADHSSAAMKRVQLNLKSEKYLRRYKAALVATLICICDMERYNQNFERANAVAQFCRCVQPDATLVHEKIALLQWHREDSADDLASMYNFLVHLAVRVPRDVQEAPLTSKFVCHVRNEAQRRSERKMDSANAKTKFASAFIDLSWGLLDNKVPVIDISKSIHGETIWRDLTDALTERSDDPNSISETDLFHVIGIAMFVRHRLSHLGDPSGALHPARAEQADHLIRYLVQALAKTCEHEMIELSTAMRIRKKNRQRSMQKKRKAAGSVNPASHISMVGNELSGPELFSTVYQKVNTPRAMGALSFLSHFWSKTLVITSQSSLAPYKTVLDRISDVTAAMDKFAEPDGITDIFARVTSSVMESASRAIPALNEDIAFADFVPCTCRQIFRRVQLQRVSLQTRLAGPTDGSVVRAVQTFQSTTYDDALKQLASKHLEAFTKATLSHIQYDVSRCRDLDNEAMGFLIAIALRRHRISRIQRKLSEYGGGRVARYQTLTPSHEFILTDVAVTPLRPQMDENTPPDTDQSNEILEASVKSTDGEGKLLQRKRRRIAMEVSQVCEQQAGFQGSPLLQNSHNEVAKTPMDSSAPSLHQSLSTTSKTSGQDVPDTSQTRGEQENNSGVFRSTVCTLSDAVRLALYSSVERKGHSHHGHSGGLWWREKLCPVAAENNLFLASESSSSSVL